MPTCRQHRCPPMSSEWPAAVAILQAVFGRNFCVFPACRPPPAANLAAALAASDGLIQRNRTTRSAGWRRSAGFRETLGRWRYLRLLSGASAAVGAMKLEVSQLPVAAGAQWGALPFTSPADRVPSRLSLTLTRVTANIPAATDVWYGLLIDEWVELIPNSTEPPGSPSTMTIRALKRPRPCCWPCRRQQIHKPG